MEQECALECGCVRVLSWWQRVLPDNRHWVMAVLAKNDSPSEMRNLTLSLVPLDQMMPPCSNQLLDTISRSKIVWMEKRAGIAVASKPPPFKRSRRTTTEGLSTNDDSLVPPRGSACVTLLMNIPPFTSKGREEFAVVATWEWRGEVDGLKTAEIFRFPLDVRDLFSERFQCSYDCLNAWKGRRSAWKARLLPNDCSCVCESL